MFAKQDSPVVDHDSLTHGLQGMAFAAAGTTAVAALAGAAENHAPLGPINAISHIVFGDEATVHDEFSAKHTLSGVLLNTAAIGSWAVVSEMLFGGKRRPATIPHALAAGAAVSAIAYVTDYHLVPDRLTPGFEKRLSNKSLLAIYGTLAVGLGLGLLAKR
jgi:hypothetical protein